MHGSPWTDEHDRLTADAVPPVPEPGADEVARIWGRVAADRGEARSRPRRWGRAAVGASVVAALLATSGVAAADLISARTGRGPVDAEDLRLGGPGEKLLPAAPDFGQVVAEETRDIPFPSEEARRLAVRLQVDDFAGAGLDERVSTGAMRAWVADQALCAWVDHWAVATRRGDEPGRDESIATIQAAPAWPAVVAIDPQPYSRIEAVESVDEHGRVSTDRYRDDSQFFYLAALGDAVEGREPEDVAAVLAEHNGYCRGLVPHLPAADGSYGGR